MRKGLKIKATFIFLSWLMILAHGILPHNHFDDIPFHHEFHNKVCNAGNSHLVIKSQAEEEDGCRISNLIFHKFSQDDQHSIMNSGCSYFHALSSSPFVYNCNYSFISGRFSDSESLRAPPGA